MNEEYRNKVFYKKDGLLPYQTRIGLLYETPNLELLRELERRVNNEEINLDELIKILQEKQQTKKI
jgi:hypothetical protein